MMDFKDYVILPLKLNLNLERNVEKRYETNLVWWACIILFFCLFEHPPTTNDTMI